MILSPASASHNSRITITSEACVSENALKDLTIRRQPPSLRLAFLRDSTQEVLLVFGLMQLEDAGGLRRGDMSLFRMVWTRNMFMASLPAGGSAIIPS